VRLVGHDKYYRQILVHPVFEGQEVMGRMVNVKIDAASRWSLEGTILKFTYATSSKTNTTDAVYQPGRKSRGKVTILRKRAKCPGDWLDSTSVSKQDSMESEGKLFIASVIIYLLPFISVSRVPLMLFALLLSHQGFL
jgi:hypothetical protein